MVIVSPSILSADFSRLREEIAGIEHSGAQYLHIDVMDGMFVPNISFGQPVLRAIRPCSGLFFDTHLMIERPSRYVEEFAKAGADLITIHVEAEPAVAETLRAIHAAGCQAGLSVKPGTPAEAVLPYLQLVDLVLVMTVEPGFGGQKFMADMLPKVTALRRAIDETGREIRLEVDGGIDAATIRQAAQAGADTFVAGSAVFGAPDPAQAVRALLAAAQTA